MQNPILEKIAFNFQPIKNTLQNPIVRGLGIALGETIGLGGAGYIGSRIGSRKEGKRLTQAFNDYNNQENQELANSILSKAMSAQRQVAASAYRAGQQNIISRIQTSNKPTK